MKCMQAFCIRERIDYAINKIFYIHTSAYQAVVNSKVFAESYNLSLFPINASFLIFSTLT